MNFGLKVLTVKLPDVYVMDSYTCTAIINNSVAAGRQSMKKVSASAFGLAK